MQKMIRNIVIITILIFGCGISVEAKEVEKVCEYNATASTSLNGTVVCNIYDNLTYNCTYQTAGDNNNLLPVIVGNWDSTDSFFLSFNEQNGNAVSFRTGKEHYNNHGTCPSYLALNYYAGGYSAWMVDTDTDIQTILKHASVQGTTWHGLILVDPNKSEGEQKLDLLKSSLEVVKGQYDFNTCVRPWNDGEKTVQRRIEDECLPTIRTQLDALEQYKNELNQLIESGKVNKKDKTVKQISESIETIKKNYETELKKVSYMENALASGYDIQFAVDVYNGKIKPVEEDPNEPNSTESGSCAILGDNLTKIVKSIIDLIQIAIPIIIIIMTIVDFAGVALSGEEKNFKAAGTKFLKRLVIGAMVILLPMLITFVIDFSGVLVPYGIERNQIFCSLF